MQLLLIKRERERKIKLNLKKEITRVRVKKEELIGKIGRKRRIYEKRENMFNST